MAVSPSFCFSDTSSESVLSCSSISYYSICMVAISHIEEPGSLVMARAHMEHP